MQHSSQQRLHNISDVKRARFEKTEVLIGSRRPQHASLPQLCNEMLNFSIASHHYRCIFHGTLSTTPRAVEQTPRFEIIAHTTSIFILYKINK